MLFVRADAAERRPGACEHISCLGCTQTSPGRAFNHRARARCTRHAARAQSELVLSINEIVSRSAPVRRIRPCGPFRFVRAKFRFVRQESRSRPRRFCGVGCAVSTLSTSNVIRKSNAVLSTVVGLRSTSRGLGAQCSRSALQSSAV